MVNTLEGYLFGSSDYPISRGECNFASYSSDPYSIQMSINTRRITRNGELQVDTTNKWREESIPTAPCSIKDVRGIVHVKKVVYDEEGLVNIMYL